MASPSLLCFLLSSCYSSSFLIVIHAMRRFGRRAPAEILVADQSRIVCVCREMTWCDILELTLCTNSAAVGTTRAIVISARHIALHTRISRDEAGMCDSAAGFHGHVTRCTPAFSSSAAGAAVDLLAAKTIRFGKRFERHQPCRLRSTTETDNDQPDIEAARVAGKCARPWGWPPSCFSTRRGLRMRRWLRASRKAPARVTRRPARSAACLAAPSAASWAS